MLLNPEHINGKIDKFVDSKFDPRTLRNLKKNVAGRTAAAEIGSGDDFVMYNRKIKR